MTTKVRWDTERDTYFDTRRTTPALKEEPKREAKPKPTANPGITKKTASRAASEPTDASWEPVKHTVHKINPFLILTGCLGAAIFHGIIQFAIWYVFFTGAIEPSGLMVGTMANASIAGFRVCWRFKQ